VFYAVSGRRKRRKRFKLGKYIKMGMFFLDMSEANLTEKWEQER
jgi:hypothetical protein